MSEMDWKWADNIDIGSGYGLSSVWAVKCYMKVTLSSGWKAMALDKTAVSPVHWLWSYCSLVLLNLNGEALHVPKQTSDT